VKRLVYLPAETFFYPQIRGLGKILPRGEKKNLEGAEKSQTPKSAEKKTRGGTPALNPEIPQAILTPGETPKMATPGGPQALQFQPEGFPPPKSPKVPKNPWEGPPNPNIRTYLFRASSPPWE